MERIAQARDPHGVRRAMEDLTPTVLSAWPELLPLLARQVLPACRDDPRTLEQAIEFCCPPPRPGAADSEVLPRHPLGDAAQEILLDWIRQAGDLPPPSAGPLLHLIERHLRAWDPGLAAAKAACEALLCRLRGLMSGTPDEVLELIGRALDPEADPMQREPNPLVLARRRNAAYLSCLRVNTAFQRSLNPLMKKAWVAWVRAHIDHDAGRCHPGAQQDLDACLDADRVEGRLSVWGEPVWSEVFRRVNAPLSSAEAQKALLIVLFKDRAPRRVLQAVQALLDALLQRLRDGRCDPEEREDLVHWLTDLLALAYQKWVAPDHAAFAVLIDAVLDAALRLAPHERFDLLLELAVLSIGSGSRSRAVMAAIEGLRGSVPADWTLLDDCLRLVRGEGDTLPLPRVFAVLKHLLDGTTERGAALALVLGAVARLPSSERHRPLVLLGLHDLMRDAAVLEDGEPPPRLRGLVFELFPPEDMLDALQLESMEDTILLSYLLQPPSWGGLALLRALVNRADVSPTGAMHQLVSVMRDGAEDLELRGALQGFLESIPPPVEDDGAL